MSRVEMNGCAALDIRLRQSYYANRRHRTKPLPPLYILILFCTGFGVYTTFGSEPVVPRALPLKWAEEDL